MSKNTLLSKCTHTKKKKKKENSDKLICIGYNQIPLFSRKSKKKVELTEYENVYFMISDQSRISSE